MNLQPLDGFWARIALVLMVLTTACEHIPTGNKWDPKTPAEQQAKGTLRGRVELLQFAGKEANQTINVELHESGDSPSEATDNQRPDADGRFAFQVSPGTYEVVATAPGYMTATRSASLGIGADLDLGSIGLQHESQGPDSVPFAARLTLAGEAESGGTTVRLRLAGRDAPFAVAVTDADGRIEVPASRAERYRLLIDRTSWRLPAPDTIYAWYPVDTEDRGGHFSPEGGDGAPIDIELLPSEAAVCGDGEIEACVEPFGACVGGTRVCVNGKWSPCATQSEERCDGIDNDCDGTVDDDLRGDRACALPNAAATCEDGRCVVVRCLGAYLDPDGSAANGCECAPTGAEGSDCNGLDDDCNGQIDENVNKLSDPRHCGDACVVCAFPNGRADCVEGRCVLAGCQDGFHDFDGQPLNGCEAACVVTNGGVEACDYVDNNCDGQVDENFQPLDENVAHCGACENDCRRFANGAFGCSAGTCVLLSCEPGHVDLDREVATGCEYACNQTHGGIEACDAVDNDCDGRTDEDFDLRNDPENCGRCGEVCTTPNAQRACVDGPSVIA